MIDQRPRYRIHRTHTGAPVAADAALSSSFPAIAQPLNAQGWKALSVVAKLDGGTNPTATYQLCQEVSYLDGSGVEQRFFRSEFSLSALADGAALLVPVYQGRVFFRLTSVTGNPTAVTLLVAGAMGIQDTDHLRVNGVGELLVAADIDVTTENLALEAGGNLTAILAKLSADPATQTTLATRALESGGNLAASATALGALADAADKTGGATSALAKLRGAVQLLVDLITVTGATADASIDADNAGTIKGALRGLAKAYFARTPAIGLQTPNASAPVNLGPNRHLTYLADSTVVSGGGAGSATFTCVANTLYELEILPDFTGGASYSDTSVFGVFKEGGAPSGDDDGTPIAFGQTRQILVGAGATVHVRARTTPNFAIPVRFKCRSVGA